MADFNPQVPATQDTNYFRYSDSVSNIKADVSKGVAIETAGTGLEGAVKLGDQAIKGSINDEVFKQANKVRDDFTGALESIRGGIVPAAVQTPTGSSALSFADDATPTAPAPAAIDAALGRVESVQAALAAGKVNDTYYTQQLNGITKSLRAQYPGYRDYIDERVAQTTGINPANAYVRNLMEDINRGATNKKTETDKITDLARGALTTGLPGAVEQYKRLQADPAGYQSQFLDWYGNANANHYAIERDNLMRANRKGSREEIASDDESKFTTLVGKTLDTNFHSQMTIAGSQTPQGILDFVKDADAHPEAYKSAQFETWATTMKSQQAVMATQLWAEANKSRDGVPSYISTVGATKVKEIIDTQVNGIYGTIISALNDKDAGRAYESMRQARAYQDDVKKDMLASPMGRAIAVTKTFNDTMGPAWTSMVTDKLLRANIDDGTRDLLNESAKEARTQYDFVSTGKTVTMKQQLDRADELIKKGQMTKQMKARYVDNLVNIADDINDPKAPVADKINVVKYLFSPEGQGMLKHIQTEYRDPTSGKTIPGKYSVFSRLTSDDIVANVTKLSKTDPDVGRMYKNYLENEAGSQLFYKEFQNLNYYTGHDDIHFTYDNGEKRNGIPMIVMTDKNGTPIVTRPPAAPQYKMGPPNQNPDYLYSINEVVGRINTGLAGMARVEKGFNGDVNSYVLNFLQHSQVQLGKNWVGIPAKIADAIAASRAPARKIEDTFKDLQ